MEISLLGDDAVVGLRLRAGGGGWWWRLEVGGEPMAANVDLDVEHQ
jgi:hypothetical protein